MRVFVILCTHVWVLTIRETCDRFIRAENRERGYKNWIASQAEELAAQKEELANKDATLAEITTELAKLREENESLKSKISKI